MFLTHLGHPGQLSVSRDQGQTSPICGCWVRSIGRRAGPGVPRAVWMSAPVKPGVSLHSCQLLQEGEGPPYRAPRAGSCLTLGKELSEETRADKARDSIGKGARVESSRVRKPRRTALPRGSQCTGGVSFKPFPNSSSWWRLISSAIFIRISCHKTTHANGYYGAWPGWGGFNQCASHNNSPCKMGYIAAPLVQAP